tara:strand:+ start:210 stop:431 length:222 start_codon:yes stop_codon:yes gene_type:complete
MRQLELFPSYAVMIEIDEGDWQYIKGSGSSWNSADCVRIFWSKEDAENEAAKWNNPEVVLYDAGVINELIHTK